MNIKNIESLTLEECKKILSANPNDKQLQDRYHVLLEEIRERESKEFDLCSTMPDYMEFVKKYSGIKDYKSKNLDIARKLVNKQEEINRIEWENRSLQTQREDLESRLKITNVFKYVLLIIVGLLLGVVAFLGIKNINRSEIDINVLHNSNSTDSISKEYYDYKNAVLKAPIIVRDIKVGNVYKDSKIETQYGETIFEANTMYLEPPKLYMSVRKTIM